MLGDFEGYIHADAYSGYDRIFLPGRAIEVACWAHLRRKFLDAETSDAECAREAIERIRMLFEIEQLAVEWTDEERRALRQERSRPLVESFGRWIDLIEPQVLPKGPLAKATGYARNQWIALGRYLDDGRLSMTNNAAERALRPLAIGRKNWMFFQREGGGKVATTLMSLLMTAKAAGVVPREYFRDVLLRISERGLTAKDLTPHNWKERFGIQIAAQRDEILRKLIGTPVHLKMNTREFERRAEIDLDPARVARSIPKRGAVAVECSRWNPIEVRITRCVRGVAEPLRHEALSTRHRRWRSFVGLRELDDPSSGIPGDRCVAAGAQGRHTK